MAGPQLKVFISYARKDASAFAEDLLAGLEAAGFGAFLDRHDIAAGEDWENRLDGLIAQSDTVVFVVSPASAKSERCAWEVSRAEALHKRVLPVIAIDVEPSEIPGTLSRRNFIYFSRGAPFGRALFELASALRTDIDWLREHTRYAELARRWRDRERNPQLLLRGSELDVARQWLQRAPADETVAPTALQHEFIDTSTAYDADQLRAERERLAQMAADQAAKEDALRRLSRRTAMGLGATGTLAVASAGLAYWGVNAEGRAAEEQRRKEEAERQSLEAAIEREASRQDIVGQLTVYGADPWSNLFLRRAGEGSILTRIALPQLKERNTSLLDVFRRSISEMRAERPGLRSLISTTMNGDVYLGRPSLTQKRVAVVISNDSNGIVPGGEWVWDDGVVLNADSWATALSEAGFEVTRILNPTRSEVVRALEDLGPRRPYDNPESDTLGLVYFGGLGLEHEDREYLYCADTVRTSVSTIVETGMRVGWLQAPLANRFAASITILDSQFSQSSR